MSDADLGPGSPAPPGGPEGPEREILSRSIEDELRQSYLDYAMSVIVRRALPDVRDGLKPVHRRVLYAMNQLGNFYNRPTRKSAYVVGEVMAKYHPHGDSAIYETIVRMAQDFMLRYPLADGQGNFGSIDRDPPAAPRYTEVRMAQIGSEMLADLDKETVDTVANYDETLQIPEVLPTRVPNLLVNGASGIAVGMATNIPPHNLVEVVNACLALLDDPGVTVDGLMEHIQGPDFPTGAIINGRAGIVKAYRTGRGRIYVRARARVENAGSGKETIVVDEIPYQVNKAQMIEKIAELVKERRVEGITEIRDESDKDGLRVVIELRRGENGDVVLNNLYAHSQLQQVFGINCVALVDGQPRTVNLRDMLDAFLKHRREVVVRRTVFLLRRARRRGHLLEGQAVALENIDEVVELIRSSPDTAEARAGLMGKGWRSQSIQALLERTGVEAVRPEDLGDEFGRRDDGLYYLSEAQAQAILELRLNRLTALEKDRLIEEYDEILKEIQELLAILASEERQREVMREELEDIRERYGDERRTEILSSQLDLTDEDLITEEDSVVTVSHRGYAKRQPLSVYQAQRRGRNGPRRHRAARRGLRRTPADRQQPRHAALLHQRRQGLLAARLPHSLGFAHGPGPRAGEPAAAGGRRTHHRHPAAAQARRRCGRRRRGRREGEEVVAEAGAADEEDAAGEEIEGGESEDAADAEELGPCVFMATANGTVKKTPLARFARPRTAGLIALRLEEGNTLVGVAIVQPEDDVLLMASSGKAARFNAARVRAMGRTARGVRGIRLGDGHSVIALIVPAENGSVLTASERGYGKRTPVGEFPTKGRGAQGVIAMRTNDRNGDLVGAVQVFDGDEIMLISDHGTLVRTHANDVSSLGRNTQGVRLIRLAEDAKLVGVQRIVETVGGDVPGDEDEAGRRTDVLPGEDVSH